MKKYFIKREAKIPFTQRGFEDLKIEREKLLGERPEAVEHLRKAREMGDLSENGYYKASRGRLTFLDSRIRRVDRLLKLATIVRSSGSGKIEIGSVVTITNGKDTVTYTVVGGYESDPLKHTVSHISPIGKAMIGKIENDTFEVVAPAGIKKYTVVAVQ